MQTCCTSSKASVILISEAELLRKSVQLVVSRKCSRELYVLARIVFSGVKKRYAERGRTQSASTLCVLCRLVGWSLPHWSDGAGPGSVRALRGGECPAVDHTARGGSRPATDGPPTHAPTPATRWSEAGLAVMPTLPPPSCRPEPALCSGPIPETDFRRRTQRLGCELKLQAKRFQL